MEDEKIEKNEEVEENVDNEESLDNELDGETFTYTVDNNNLTNDYKGSSDDKSIVYILIGVVILVFIIICLVLFANKGKDGNSFADVESSMVSAAKDYYKKHSDLLPVSDYVTVSSDTLIHESFLKPFSEMVSDDENCSGYVNVYSVDDDYAYFPYLKCSSYESLKLSKKIVDDNSVTTGDGLYNMNGSYIFRGEYPKNFVKFNNKSWRIIGLNADGSIRLIYNDKKVDKNVWDDRYNNEKGSYYGINNFRVSRILEALNEMYTSGEIVSDSNKTYLVKQNWCIGKLPIDDAPISSLNLCNETYSDLYIGVVKVDDVLLSSLDSNCKNLYDISCTNYNYFYEINVGWTLNASSSNSYVVFGAGAGEVFYRNASNSNYIRPVINLNSNVLYGSGDGTSENPYVIGK